MRAISTTNWWISVKDWFVRPSNYSKRLTSVTNRAFSVQYACGLSTTPTLLARVDATAHAQAQCRKGSLNHKTALQLIVAILLYNGYRARWVCGPCDQTTILHQPHPFSCITACNQLLFTESLVQGCNWSGWVQCGLHIGECAFDCGSECISCIGESIKQCIGCLTAVDVIKNIGTHLCMTKI